MNVKILLAWLDLNRILRNKVFPWFSLMVLAFYSGAGWAGCVVTSAADSGAGSLRDAIATCSTGTISFSISNAAINLASTLVINNAIPSPILTINGGSNNITISGGNAVRVLDITASGTVVTLRNLTVNGGAVSAEYGAGIRLTASASLTVEQCTFENNNVPVDGNGRPGGAIAVQGSTNLTVNNSVFRNNVAQTGGAISVESTGTATINDSLFDSNSAGAHVSRAGGAILADNGGTVTVNNSLFTNNRSGGIGGAIGVQGSGQLTLTNSTFSGNSMRSGISYGGAVGISENATATIRNSTFKGNSANTGGNSVAVGHRYDGGVTNVWVTEAATLTLQNSIIASGSGSASDCTVAAAATAGASGTNNLLQGGTGNCPGVVSTVDPLLGPLQNNTGLTNTMAPLTGSPAINTGDNVTCALTDARGINRPQGVACDLGAVESFGTAPSFGVSPFGAGVGSGAKEDTEVEITFANMLAQASITDADPGDSVAAFVVKSVTQGTLKIGASAASATTYISGSNNIIDSSNNAYWTPAADSNGTLNAFTVSARDLYGLESATSPNVPITVTAVNDQPVFTAANPPVVNEDAGAQTVTGWITSANVGGGGDETATQSPVYITGVASNAALFSVQPSVNAAGALSYTPAANANGAATFSVTMQDSGGTANGGVDTSVTQIFTLMVNAVNDQPSFTASNPVTVNEDAGSQTIVNWAAFSPNGGSDEISQTAVYAVSAISNAALFSVVPSVDVNGNLSYTPAANANGSSGFSVTVMDSGGTANGGMDVSLAQNFTITVNAVNDQPAFSATNPAAVTENSGAVSIPAWANLIPGGGTDESGQTAVYTVSGVSNPGLFSVPPAVGVNGTLTYTPAANTNGSSNFSVTAQDSGGTLNGGTDTSASQTFTIIVNAVNAPPSFTASNPPAVNEDAGAQIVSGWAVFSPGGGVDEAGQTATYFVSNISNPALFSVTPAISPTGTLTYTPNVNISGLSTFDVFVQDNGGGTDTSATQTFTLTVNPVNDQPSFSVSITNPTINENGGAQSLAGWAVFSPGGGADESGQTAVYTVSGISNPGLFSVSPAVGVNGTLTYTPAANTNGSSNFNVTVQDSGGTLNGGTDTSVSQTFTVTVNAVNATPSFTAVNPPAVNEDAGAQIIPGWAVFSPGGGADEAGQTATYLISNVSNPALFSAGPSVDAAGNLSYTPVAATSGTSTFDVQVQDNGGGVDTSPAQTFTITVTGINDQPSFTAANPPAVNEDSGVQVINNWALFSPGAGEASQTATYLVSNISNPALFSVNPVISPTGTLTYTPAVNANGTSTFQLAVQDNGGTANGGIDTSVTQSFTVTVNAVNDQPSFSAGNPPAISENAGAQNIAGWASFAAGGGADEAGQTAVYTVSSVSNTALFASGPSVDGNGNLTYTPATNVNGTSGFSVSVKDNGTTANGGVDTSATQIFTVTVNAVNAVPSFSAANPPAVNEDAGAQVVTGWAAFSPGGGADEAGQSVAQYIISGISNPGLFSAPPSVDVNGVLGYTPAANANGVSTFAVQVQDNGGGTDTSPAQTFTLTVNALNDQPSFTVSTVVLPEVNEDAGLQTVTGWASFNPGGGPDESTQLPFYLVNNVSNPALFSSIPAVDGSGTLTYTPAAGASGNSSFTVAVQDDGGIAGGGSNTSPGQTFSITVKPLVDGAPVVSGSTSTKLYTPTSPLFVFPGVADSSGITHFHISNIVNGVLTPAPDANGFITKAQGAAGIVFFPSGSNNGSFDVSSATCAIDALTCAGPATTVAINITKPVLSITAVTNPNESGPVDGSFNLKLSYPIPSAAAGGLPVPITYAVGGNASPTLDYNALSGSASIPAGSDNVNIIVTPVTDNIADPGETVTVTLNAGNDYALDVSQSATLTINNSNIPAATVTANTANQPAEAGNTAGQFSVTLAPAASNPVEVFYTVSGTAVAGEDFSPLSGSVTVPAGGSANIPVQILDDSVIDPNETITVTLTATAAYSLGAQASDTLTIIDDDFHVPAVTTGALPNEQGAVKGAFVISLNRIAPVGGVTLSYTVAGSATPGADYLALPGTITVPAGQSNAVIEIIPVDDGIVDPGETVEITLTGGTPSVQIAAGSEQAGLVIATVDDKGPVVSLSAGTTPAEGGSNGTFVLDLNPPAPAGGLSVNYNVSGTATGGIDYIALSGSTLVAEGNTTITIPVQVLEDTALDPAERIVLSLLPGTDYTPNPAAFSAELVITDNDVPLASVTASGQTTESGESGLFAFSLTPPAPFNVEVAFSLSGKATSGADYQVLGGSVIIPAGSAGVELPLSAVDDDLVDPDENVILTLEPGNLYQTGADNSAELLIKDNDSTLEVKFSGVNFQTINGIKVPVFNGLASAVNILLSHVELRINDVAGNPVLNWTQVQGTEFWQFSQAGLNFVDQQTYFVLAKAVDSLANESQQAELSFKYLAGEQAFTTLFLELSSNAVLNNDLELQIIGKLNRFPLTGESLANLGVKLHITQPDGGKVTVSGATSTNTGQFTFHATDPGFPALNQNGAYLVQAEFAGNSGLAPSQSPELTLLVGVSAGYALVVEGKTADSEGLDAHNKTLNRIYRRLKERGFQDENIVYLNYVTNQPGVDSIPSKGAIQQGLLDLQNRMNGSPAPMYIIMVDHGGIEGNFYLDNNGDNTRLTPAELGNWLDLFEAGLTQSALKQARSVLLGACYSGSFIPALSKPGRVIITSATNSEVSYKGPLESDGIRSGELFMEELFHRLTDGISFKEAFIGATESTERATRRGGSSNAVNAFQDEALQHPLLDDNGDGLGSNTLDLGGDGDLADTLYLGARLPSATNFAGEPADILKVTDTVFLGPSQVSATLQIVVNDANRVNAAPIDIRKPALELQPSIQARTEQQNIEGLLRIPTMQCSQVVNLGQCSASANVFEDAGRYEIFYFVRDSLTNDISKIKRSLVYKNYPGNAPPLPFNLLSPLDGSTPQTSLLFDWEASSDADGAVTYTFLIATDPGFSNLTYREEELLYSMTAIDRDTLLLDGSAGLKDQLYYWKVLAVDPYGAVQESPVFSFTPNTPNADYGSHNIDFLTDFQFTGGTSGITSDFINITNTFGEPIDVTTQCELNRCNFVSPSVPVTIAVDVPGFDSQQFVYDPGVDSDGTRVSLKSPNAGLPGSVQFVAGELKVQETAGSITLAVERSGGSKGTISVDYSTVPGTATTADYQAVSGTLTWLDGDTASKPIRINITNDSEGEPTESFSVTLSGTGLGSNTQLQVKLLDDEIPAQGIAELAQITATTNEQAGTLAIQVERVSGAEGEVSLTYSVNAQSTATADKDFSGGFGTLTWPDGDSTPKVISLGLINDTQVEGSETIILVLDKPQGGLRLGDKQQLAITLEDDDIPDCPTSAEVIDFACDAKNQLMGNLKQITAKGQVNNAVLLGSIINEGSLFNSILGPDVQISGGRLAGFSAGNSSAKLHNVYLNGVYAIGGTTLSGTIGGDGYSTLGDVKVADNTVLAGVIVTTKTSLGTNIQYGEAVRFADISLLPPQLTGYTPVLFNLPQPICAGTVNFAKRLDLGKDIITPAAGIISNINAMPMFRNNAWFLRQDPQFGWVWLDLGGGALRVAVQPVSVRRSTHAPGLELLDAEQVRLWVDGTATGTLEIEFQPALFAPCALDSALRNMLGVPGLSVLNNGNIQVPAGSQYFSIRPGRAAQPDNSGAAEGLYIGPPGSTGPLPWGDEYLIFRMGGQAFKQNLYPGIAEPDVLRAAATAVDHEETATGVTGVVSFVWNGRRYRGMPDYVVSQGAARSAFAVESAGDQDGDGLADFRLLFPSGAKQVVFARN